MIDSSVSLCVPHRAILAVQMEESKAKILKELYGNNPIK